MGTKQVRLDEDVYAKIADKKRDDESFSDAIDRLTSDWSLSKWGGWMDEETAKRYRDRVRDLEDADRAETDQLLEQLDLDVE